MLRGPCAKRRVVCTIILRDSGVRFVGENDCANPQPALVVGW